MKSICLNASMPLCEWGWGCMCGWMCVGRWVVLLTEWMHVGVCVQVQACIKFTYTLTKVGERERGRKFIIQVVLVIICFVFGLSLNSYLFISTMCNSYLLICSFLLSICLCILEGKLFA